MSQHESLAAWVLAAIQGGTQPNSPSVHQPEHLFSLQSYQELALLIRRPRTEVHTAVHHQYPWNYLGSAGRYWDMDPPKSRLATTPGNQGSCNQRPQDLTLPKCWLTRAPGPALHNTGWASAPGSTELWISILQASAQGLTKTRNYQSA